MTRSVLLVASLALVLGGCAAESGGGDAGTASFPDEAFATITSEGGLSIEVRTAPQQPPSRGESSVELTLRDGDGKPVDGLDAAADLWMPAMGHGASTDPTVSAEAGGRYRFDRVELFMPGRWEMRLTFSGEATDRAIARFDIP